jgi:hypothetical protein
VPLHHPESSDLEFLYGTILTDGKDEYSDSPTENVSKCSAVQCGLAFASYWV